MGTIEVTQVGYVFSGKGGIMSYLILGRTYVKTS